MWTEIAFFIIGFIVYFAVSLPAVIGYNIVRTLCKKIKNNENTKDLEDQIIEKSYIIKAFEKITTMTLCAIFLFELDFFILLELNIEASYEVFLIPYSEFKTKFPQ